MILYMKNFGDTLTYKTDGKTCAENIVTTFIKLENTHQPLMFDFLDVKKISPKWCDGFFSVLIDAVGLSRFKNAAKFSNLSDDSMAAIQDVLGRFEKE